MKKKRDAAGPKVYRAEDWIRKYDREHLSRPKPTLEDVEIYLHRVMETRFFRRLWVDEDDGHRRGEITGGKVELTPGYGRVQSLGAFKEYQSVRCHHCNSPNGDKIVVITMNLPPWARRESIVLHELAHAVQTEEQIHGRQFARIYLALVKEYMGKEAGQALGKGFQAEKVKWQRLGGRPGGKHADPNHRLVLQARLEKARESRRQNIEDRLQRDQDDAREARIRRLENDGS